MSLIHKEDLINRHIAQVCPVFATIQRPQHEALVCGSPAPLAVAQEEDVADVATAQPLPERRGSIVGRQAAELISVIAVAVTAGLTVTDLAESILVHPALSEALSEAAE